jgi:diguanylate cyclase (GGDEF)-like protein
MQMTELLSASQALWNEGSCKALLRQLARQLQCLGITEVGFWEVKPDGLVEVDIAKGTGLERLAVGDQIPAALRGLGLARFEADGIYQLTVGGQALSVARFGEVSGFIFCVPTLAAHASNEFLIRQAQGAFRLLQRLDSTEAKLFQDELTDLYNYRFFDPSLESEIRRAERFQSRFCVMFIDLDDFKAVNDSHGHLVGSSCLKQAAKVIRDAVREVDIPIRYGGDEFVVILLGASSQQGMAAGERVRKAIAEHKFIADSGATFSVTASIGVAAFPEHARDKAGLVKLADATMYKSKRLGKNRVTMLKDVGHPVEADLKL